MNFAVQIERLWASLRSTITRGVISSINDGKATQTLQVDLRFDEASSDIEHFQPFGLSFHPPAESEAIVVATGASQDHLVAIAATDRSTRPTSVGEGEGGLYTPSGWKLFCRETDDVDIGAKDLGDEKLVAWAQKVEDELEKIKTAHNEHTHKHSVCSGGDSDVFPNAGTSATPNKTYTPASVACSKTRVE